MFYKICFAVISICLVGMLLSLAALLYLGLFTDLNFSIGGCYAI